MVSSNDKSEMIKDFETLVDELTKEEPNEHQVKMLMEKLQMNYDTDSINRIGKVLKKMDEVIFESNKKRGSYDLQ